MDKNHLPSQIMRYSFYHVLPRLLFFCQNYNNKHGKKVLWKFTNISSSNIFHSQFIKSFTFTTRYFLTELFFFFYFFILRQSSALTCVMCNYDVSLGLDTQCNIKHLLHEWYLPYIELNMWISYISFTYRYYLINTSFFTCNVWNCCFDR